jgi:hypothetical protein
MGQGIRQNKPPRGTEGGGGGARATPGAKGETGVWILNLDAEVDDGDVRVVEEVQDVRLAEVQLLELNVVDGGVGDGRARQLYIVQGALPHRLVLHTIELSPAVLRIRIRDPGPF